MTSTPGSWSATEFFTWLRQFSSNCEPGIKFQDDPLLISKDHQVDLCATDATGQPLLFFWSEDCGADLENVLLDVMSALQNEPGRFTARFPKLSESHCHPRAVVYTVGPIDQARRRLELLAKAIPLRVISIRLNEASTSPKLNIELPSGLAPPYWELAGLCEIGSMHCQRLIKACNLVQPSVSVLFNNWPLLLSGRNGNFAALHCQEGHVKFVTSNNEVALFEEEDVDHAIDLIMREQYQALEAEKTSNQAAPAAS